MRCVAHHVKTHGVACCSSILSLLRGVVHLGHFTKDGNWCVTIKTKPELSNSLLKICRTATAISSGTIWDTLVGHLLVPGGPLDTLDAAPSIL